MKRAMMMVVTAASIAALSACGGPETDAELEPVDQVQPAPAPAPAPEPLPGDTLMHGDTLQHQDTVPPAPGTTGE